MGTDFSTSSLGPVTFLFCLFVDCGPLGECEVVSPISALHFSRD